MNQGQRLPAFIVLSPEDVAARAYELYLKRARPMASTLTTGFVPSRN
jgi:hypothetical protein